jgi:Phosphopantetheine attachment site.
MAYNIKGAIEILSKILKKEEEEIRQIDPDDSLEAYGLESIESIKLIVDLEEHYKFEFRDEDLIFDKFNTCNKLFALLDSYLGDREGI